MSGTKHAEVVRDGYKVPLIGITPDVEITASGNQIICSKCRPQ